MPPKSHPAIFSSGALESSAEVAWAQILLHFNGKLDFTRPQNLLHLNQDPDLPQNLLNVLHPPQSVTRLVEPLGLVQRDVFLPKTRPSNNRRLT
jgi:hypothetical protein